MKSKVSVIIPIYNSEKYLLECLNSVSNQYLKDIEIICINDGSVDKTPQILDNYGNKDYRVKIIKQKNKGVGAARNSGLSVATGTYVQFLDSDDMLEPETLEYAVQQMEEKNLDVFYFDARVIFESGQLEKEKSSYKTYYHRENHYQDVRTGSQLFTEWIKDGGFRPNGNIQMIRRDFLLQSGVKFIPGIVQEDNAFTAEVMLHAQRVCHENKPLYIRRLRPGSIMTKPQAFSNAYGYFRCAMAMEKYFICSTLSENTRSALQIFCQSLLRNMAVIFKNIPKDEKAKIQALSAEERASMLYMYWYSGQIEKNRDENKKITADCNVLKKKNNMLSEKYKELSANNEILNKQFSALAEQAEDIRHENTLYKQQMAEQEKKLQNLKADLTAMEQSLSFRLGRKITWLPRKIRDKIVR